MKPEIKDRIKRQLPAWIISGIGMLALCCAFVLWIVKERPDAAGIAAAALSVALFILGCLRFFP